MHYISRMCRCACADSVIWGNGGYRISKKEPLKRNAKPTSVFETNMHVAA